MIFRWVLLTGWLCNAVTCEASWTHQRLRSWGAAPVQDGWTAHNVPVRGPDGALYGLAAAGGAHGAGVLYRFNPLGDDYRAILHFPGGHDGQLGVGEAAVVSLATGPSGRLHGFIHVSVPGTNFFADTRLALFTANTNGDNFQVLQILPNGAEPLGSLVHGSDGTLFGLYTVPNPTVSQRKGIVFRMQPDGAGFAEICEVANPTGGLAVSATDQLFGVVIDAVYRLDANGANFAWLHTFPAPADAAPEVVGALLPANDGILYGRSFRGGTNNTGFIFRLRPDGSDVAIMRHQSSDPLDFGTSFGASHARLMEGSDGRLYGSFAENGLGLDGFVFGLNKNGSGWTNLQAVPNLGSAITVGVVEGADSALYGTQKATEFFRLARDGSAFEVVHALTEPPSVQPRPVALARGRDFRLYGLSDHDGAGGRGTLFQLGFDGNGLVRLHEFGSGAADSQGQRPLALCVATNGEVFGLVGEKGSGGAGIFRHRLADGSFTWITALDTNMPARYASMIAGSDGWLYGIFDRGFQMQTATVFRVSMTGDDFLPLSTLSGGSWGGLGNVGLTAGGDGRLYGATTRHASAAGGQIFRLNKDGSGFQSLHEVRSAANQAGYADGPLLWSADGWVYGLGHAAPGQSPFAFRLSHDGGQWQVLRTFTNSVVEGGLTFGFDGKLYGCHANGGPYQAGAFFHLNPDGTGYEEFLYLRSGPMGRWPTGTLLVGPDGAFNGLTEFGGESGLGTIFRLATPAALINWLPGSIHLNAFGQPQASIQGPTGQVAEVWSSEDMIRWSVLQSVPLTSTDTPFVDTNSTITRRFYRAVSP